MSIEAVIYTMPEVAARVGVEYRTLHTWLRRGLITPTRMTTGSGTPTLFTEADIQHVIVLARLRQAGCGMDLLELAARQPIVSGKVRVDLDHVSVEVSCGE